MFPSRSLNVNITKLFCRPDRMLLLLPTAAVLEISVASQKGRGKLCYLINIQLIHLFVYFKLKMSVFLRWSLQ